MKKILSSLLLLSSISAFASCPDLTGEYKNCHHPELGTPITSIELITVIQNGKYTLDATTDNEYMGEFTEGDNTFMATNLNLACSNNSAVFNLKDLDGNFSQKFSLRLNSDNDLVYSLHYDVDTANEGKMDLVCKRK